LQVFIGDIAGPLGEGGLIDDGLVLPVAHIDVPVNAVVRHVGEAAREPPVKGRFRLIQHLVPLLEPLQVAHLLRPEILPRLRVKGQPSMLIIGLLRDGTLDNSSLRDLKDSLLNLQGL